MYHVKEVFQEVPGDLDLNVADDEEFSPDKLRANLERLYMTVGLGMIGFANHIARLRSWRETQRTAWACTVGFVNSFTRLERLTRCNRLIFSLGLLT